jgi:hypothetical protein
LRLIINTHLPFEGALKVALRLVAKGMSVEEAADVAGVSLEVLRSVV